MTMSPCKRKKPRAQRDCASEVTVTKVTGPRTVPREIPRCEISIHTPSASYRDFPLVLQTATTNSILHTLLHQDLHRYVFELDHTFRH